MCAKLEIFCKDEKIILNTETFVEHQVNNGGFQSTDVDLKIEHLLNICFPCKCDIYI